MSRELDHGFTRSPGHTIATSRDHKIREGVVTQEQGKALEERTREFAVAVLRLVRALPSTAADQVLGRQLLRAGSAIGANYRAARRARSRREFVARLAIVVEESDESVYWIELLARMPTGPSRDLRDLLQEARQLRAIFSASLRTAKSRMRGA